MFAPLERKTVFLGIYPIKKKTIWHVCIISMYSMYNAVSIILDNYYTSIELEKALLFCKADCCRTLRKNQGLPKDLWDGQLEKRKQPKLKFEGEIGFVR